MRVLTYVGALAVAAGAAGCSVAMPPTPVPRTAVIVQNHSTFDVDVFIWDGWNRATGLGFVAAGDTADLDVPETVMTEGGPYSLEARPTAAGEYPTNSEQFALRAGYRITWVVPPADALGAADSMAPPAEPEAAGAPGPADPSSPLTRDALGAVSDSMIPDTAHNSPTP